MDLVEQRIKNILCKDITEPNNYEYMIRSTINKNFYRKTRKDKFVSSFATACACLLVISSVVFAKDITDIIKKWFLASNGVEKAIDNGYIDTPNQDYVESKDAKIKVTNLIMDDTYLGISFNAIFNKKIDYKDLSKIDFNSIKISDEENVIFEYSSKNNGIEEEIDNRNLYAKYSIYVININENEINFTIDITSDELPKNKKLKINIEDILLYSEEHDKEEIIEGKWNMQLDIPEKFYSRESITYVVDKTNNEHVDINSVIAKVDNTGMTFCVEIEMYEGIKDRMSEYDGISSWKDYLSIKPNAYVESDSGDKFYCSAKTYDKENYRIDQNTLKYTETFNITKYNLTQKLRVVLETGRGELITIDLKQQK